MSRARVTSARREVMTERWTLTRQARGVHCVQSPHPLGVELRVIVDPDDLRRSEVFRDRADADAAAAAWRDAFEAKGWRPPPILEALG